MHKLLDKDGAQHLVDKFLSDQDLQDDKLDEIEEKFDDLYSIVGIEHYGIKIDKNNSDTSARIVYTHDCENYTPARMDYANGVFDIGSWGNAFFMKNNYPAMCNFYGVEQYKLDKNNHSLKEDGTSSDVADETYNGNAMSVFDCHIWMKFWEDDNYQYLEVSNYKLDDEFKDYPYVRADGSKADKLYYPMYPGYKDSNNRLRSISGVKASSSTTTSQEVQYASNCGTNWSIGDWSHYLWLHSLMLLISKNFNSQVAFGNGNMSGGSSTSGFKTNGLLNASGQFFGYNTNSDSMKAFYQENVYANRWQRLLGFYNNRGTYKIKMVPPYTYNETFEGYTTVSSPTVPLSGYLKDLSFDSSYGLLPKTVGGSSTTYVGDYFYANNNQTDLLFAGGASEAYCGSWCLLAKVRATVSSWDAGASSYLTEPIHFDLNTIYGSSPIYFEQDNYAQPLADYTIFGNSYQDGTPTPDDPVEVVGCGVRTENLINASIPGNYRVELEPGKIYCLSKYTGSGQGGTPSAQVYNKNGNMIIGDYINFWVSYSFICPPDGKYAIISFMEAAKDAVSFVEAPSTISTNEVYPQTYIPYGYKIPLTVNGTEYPIYLGQVPTTRKIKKMVLTGEEDWAFEATLSTRTVCKLVTEATFDIGYCTHINWKSSYGEQEYNRIVLGGQYGHATLFVSLANSILNGQTLADFKAYLSAQYDAGTPVTIWYILAEPETGIVNEPLHGIGDYADTISFAQASVTLPTITPTPGSNTLSIGTTLQPSQISITGHIKEISQ